MVKFISLIFATSNQNNMKQDIKEMFTTLNDFRKEDPKEFYLSIITMVVGFTAFYFALWFGAIIEGRI